MKTKKIKVLYSSRSTSGGFYHSGTVTTNPKISMEGKWLEALGFHIGDQLEVDCEEGAIHIRLAQTVPAMVCEPETDYHSSSKRKSGK